MPDVRELFDAAAPDAAGSAPLDDIMARGRRRQRLIRGVAVAVPVVVALAAIGVGTMLGPGARSPVVDDPPMADRPPVDEPETSPSPPAEDDPAESTPEDTDPPGGDGAPADALDGWVEPADLHADVLVVSADATIPSVTRFGADGSLDERDLEGGEPNAAGLVPDADGGFAWQPDRQDADPAPVLHMDAAGEVRTLGGDGAERTTLVGRDVGRNLPLATWTRGEGFEDMRGDLLAFPVDGGTPEVIHSDVVAWETGVLHAASLEGEASIYAQYVEAMELLVVNPPDSGPVTVFEGGEGNGQYLRGVGILADGSVGIAIVTTPTIVNEPGTARLLTVDLAAAEISGEIEVPMDLGIESAELADAPRAVDVSVGGGHVLVNRVAGATWLAPLVYDVDAQTWAMLEHREGGAVVGRAFLAPPTTGGPDDASGQAACVTQDEGRRNAAPEPGQLALYLVCEGSTESNEVYRLPVGFEPTGDVEADLERLLDAVLAPLADETLIERGYLTPVEAGQVELRSVSVDSGTAVLDLGFPGGAGNLTTSYLSNVFHHVLRGTVFQFEQIERLELRQDGSCDDYGETFQIGECIVFTREHAPWNS